jgi:hypothetical protein
VVITALISALDYYRRFAQIPSKVEPFPTPNRSRSTKAS